MNGEKSFDELLELLLVIKKALCDTAEPSVIKLLDEAIAEIKQLKKANGSEFGDSKQRVIFALGKFLDKLPSILSLIRLLSG